MKTVGIIAIAIGLIVILYFIYKFTIGKSSVIPNQVLQTNGKTSNLRLAPDNGGISINPDFLPPGAIVLGH